MTNQRVAAGFTLNFQVTQMVANIRRVHHRTLRTTNLATHLTLRTTSLVRHRQIRNQNRQAFSEVYSPKSQVDQNLVRPQTPTVVTVAVEVAVRDPVADFEGAAVDEVRISIFYKR